MSEDEQNALYTYLDCAQQERDNDMIIDVLVALKRGPRGPRAQEAWGRILAFAGHEHRNP